MARSVSRKRASRDGETATGLAYVELKRLIHTNALVPGQMILQQDLARRLGVSRTPSREALIRLDAEQLLEIRPRRGVLVVPITLADLADIYDSLAALEAHAARSAVERGVSAEALARLSTAHTAMKRALEAGNLAAWVQADETFHKIVVGASGNARLGRIVNALWERLARVRVRMADIRPMPAASNRDHAALLAAIRRRQAERAFEVHLRHHRRSAAAMLDVLSRHGVSVL